jgi:hypothetical protein
MNVAVIKGPECYIHMKNIKNMMYVDHAGVVSCGPDKNERFVHIHQYNW